MARPHLGLILPNYGEGLDAERLADSAVAAEQAGFDSGWVTDHVVVPPEHAPIYGTIAEALSRSASWPAAPSGSSSACRRSSSPSGTRSSP